MTVIFIAKPKCMLAASHAGPWWVTSSIPTDRRTYDRPLHYAWHPLRKQYYFWTHAIVVSAAPGGIELFAL